MKWYRLNKLLQNCVQLKFVLVPMFVRSLYEWNTWESSVRTVFI